MTHYRHRNHDDDNEFGPELGRTEPGDLRTLGVRRLVHLGYDAAHAAKAVDYWLARHLVLDTGREAYVRGMVALYDRGGVA